MRPDPNAAPPRTARPLLLRVWRTKVVLTAAILAYYLAGYFTLNRFPFEAYHELPLLPWVDELPLLVWTFAGYNSVFVLCAAGIWLLPDRLAAHRYLISVYAAYTVNFVFFALYPSMITRPPLPEVDSAWLWLARLTRAVDGPYTSFPSLHIANCFVVVFWYWKSRLRLVFLVWALFIAASTLTTRQHAFVDLPAGALVGLLGVVVARGCSRSRRERPRERA